MENESLPLRVQIDQLKNFLHTKGYSPSTVRHYMQCWNKLLDYADSENRNTYSQEFGNKFLTVQRGIDLTGSLSGKSKRDVRGIRLLDSFLFLGIVAEFRKRVQVAPMAFLSTVEQYVLYLQSLNQTHKSIKSKKSRVKQLLHYLECKDVRLVADITKDHILGFMVYLTQTYSSSARSNILYTVKDFFVFCEGKELVKEKLSPLLKGIYTNQNERLPSTYTATEVAQLLQSVDRDSAEGKKIYAILVLAAQLGIRSSDIINIKIQDINWEQGVIGFYQCKGGFFIQLPLVDNVKYALLDYLKNSRPDTEYPHVFVRSRAPIAPYKESAIIYAIVAKQMAIAEISTTGKHHGPHALRHSMASSLLEEETPLPIIAAALGHSSTKNTSRYLRIDIDTLRMVALEVPV